jgi:hypothetical protein
MIHEYQVIKPGLLVPVTVEHGLDAPELLLPMHAAVSFQNRRRFAPGLFGPTHCRTRPAVFWRRTARALLYALPFSLLGMGTSPLLVTLLSFTNERRTVQKHS